eukprot:scaffold3670_cov124-Cylindrotheca_fusiformis.AAC.29
MSPPVSVAKKQVTVALVGYSSVGKTTALNAILKNNYSFICESKPTIGINHFRVAGKKLSSENRNGIRSAESVCYEILRDNKAHRVLPLGSRKRVPRRKVFDITVSEPAFEVIEETPLFFVDVPGIDFSNTDCPYKSYVDEHFHTFDAVILVMDTKTDAKQQNRMLRFIRRNLSRIKTVPVIILGNERSSQLADSPQLSELAGRVDKIFDIQSSDRVIQLDCITSSFCGDLDFGGDEMENDLELGDTVPAKPIFVPVNLHNAFRYRLASANLNLDQVSRLGDSTIDKICQDEIGGGPVWEGLSKHDRLDIAYSALSTPGDDYKLRETNFPTFMAHLERVLGGVPKHELVQNTVVKENELTIFSSISNFFCSQHGQPDKNGGVSIHEIRRLSLGLADTLSEVSSKEDQDHYASFTTEYSDDTSGTYEISPAGEHSTRKWKSQRTACILVLSLLVFGTIFAILFVVVSYFINSRD